MNPEQINEALVGIFLRLAVELAVLLIIVFGIYRKFSGKKENMFSFFLMGMVIFLICVLLKRVEIQLGIALGLFAVFSIIRFRTLNYPGKDMSYLFTIMGLSAINAMFNFPNPIRGTILFNVIIIATILFLEIALREKDGNKEKDSGKKDKKKDKKKAKKEKEKNSIRLIYDNVMLLGPESRRELLKDISKRTGNDIYEIEIRKIDLKKGNAELDAYFHEKLPTD
jgi:large-conductance mechanosensitive channel